MIYSGNIRTPNSIAEVLAFIKDSSPAVHFVAGATDWSVQSRNDIDNELAVIDLSSVKDLKGVSKTSEYITIGAMETMTSISENQLLREEAACLAEAAGKLGSWQIRNCATIGGNVANVSPAADTPVALAALGAIAILHSQNGVRTRPVQEIASSLGCSILENGEFISSIRIPIAHKRISAFGKIGSRSEVSIARLNMAGSLTFSDKGQISGLSFYVGALGARPLRAARAEEVLTHRGFASAKDYCDELSLLVEETIPGRYSMRYKRRAIQALGMDVLESLREKAKREGYSL